LSYTTVADIRAVAGMEDVEAWGDALVTDAITYAEAVIDDYCGTSFEHKTFTETHDGNNAGRLMLDVMFPQTLVSVTVDGVAADTTGWALLPEGYIVRDDGIFTYSHPGRNVVVAGTAGVTSSAPEEIALAARGIAIAYLRQMEDRIPQQALSVQSEFGQVMLAQPGGHWRPTEFPAINTLLNRWRQRPPTIV